MEPSAPCGKECERLRCCKEQSEANKLNKSGQDGTTMHTKRTSSGDSITLYKRPLVISLVKIVYFKQQAVKKWDQQIIPFEHQVPEVS